MVGRDGGQGLQSFARTVYEGVGGSAYLSRLDAEVRARTNMGHVELLAGGGLPSRRGLKSLVPYVLRAKLLHQALRASPDAAAAYAQSWSNMGAAVIVLGQGRRVVTANDPGQALLERRDALRMDNGVLACADGFRTEALARSLRPGVAENGPLWLALPGLGGAVTLTVEAYPLGVVQFGAASQIAARAMLVVREKIRGERPDLQVLLRHGLNLAEAVVMCAFSRTNDARAAADQLRMPYRAVCDTAARALRRLSGFPEAQVRGLLGLPRG
jgi:hypothetical protein